MLAYPPMTAEQQAAMERIIELQTRSEPLLGINVNDFRVRDLSDVEPTVAQIRTVINDVNAMINTVQAAQNDVNRMMSGVQSDINTARALEQSARNAFSADFNHLRSFIDPGSGAIREMLESVVMSILTESVFEYLAYGERALEVLEKVKAMQEKLPRNSRPERNRAEPFRGRDVRFPAQRYPRFFMGILATDVLTPSQWHWAFDLRGVSSDPDRSNVPTTLAFALTEGGERRNAAFNGMADFRSSATERFNAEVTGGGFPVSISGGHSLDRVGIGGFSGGSNFGLNASGRPGGSFSAGGDISFAQASLRNPSNTFTRAADEAIRQVDAVRFGINYEHVAGGRDRFSLDTNIDDILMAAMRSIINQYRRQAEEALERALRAKFEQYIDGRFLGADELDALFRLVQGDKAAVDDLRNALDNKRRELEARIVTLVGDTAAAAEAALRQAADEARAAAEAAARQAEEEARRVADEARAAAEAAARQAAQDALQGQRPTIPAPSVPAPSLPSIPGLPRR